MLCAVARALGRAVYRTTLTNELEGPNGDTAFMMNAFSPRCSQLKKNRIIFIYPYFIARLGQRIDAMKFIV